MAKAKEHLYAVRFTKYEECLVYAKNETEAINKAEQIAEYFDYDNVETEIVEVDE